MSAIDYPACLRDLIESEIFGEAVSLALLDVDRTDRDRFQQITAEGPVEDREILSPMVRHESAILR